MKKVFLIVTAVFASYFTQAQSSGGGIKLGIKAGANLSNFAGKDAKVIFSDEDGTTYEPQNKIGLHAGIFADFGISEMVSIRPEALYSNKGFKIEEDGSSIKMNLHYIDVPVLAHINAGGLFFEFGPTASYLVKAKTKLDVEGEDSGDLEIGGDVTDQFKKVDIGYAAGIGYEAANGIGLNLRYNGGLSKLPKDDAEDAKVRNSNFQLSLSYTFGR